MPSVWMTSTAGSSALVQSLDAGSQRARRVARLVAAGSPATGCAEAVDQLRSVALAGPGVVARRGRTVAVEAREPHLGIGAAEAADRHGDGRSVVVCRRGRRGRRPDRSARRLDTVPSTRTTSAPSASSGSSPVSGRHPSAVAGRATRRRSEGAGDRGVPPPRAPTRSPRAPPRRRSVPEPAHMATRGPATCLAHPGLLCRLRCVRVTNA